MVVGRNASWRQAVSQTFKDIVQTIETELALMKQERQDGIPVVECTADHMANILFGIHEAAEQMKHRGHHRKLRAILGETVQFVVSTEDRLLRLFFLAVIERKAKYLPEPHGARRTRGGSRR